MSMSDESDLLLAFDDRDPVATVEDLAIATRWTLSRVRRITADLLEHDLVAREGDTWRLTSAGRELRRHYEKDASTATPHHVVELPPDANLDVELDKALAVLSPEFE